MGTKHEELARRWARAVASGRDEDWEAILAHDFVDHSAPPEASGRASVAARTRMIHQAFSDVQVTVEDLVADGADGAKLAWRWRMTGIHSGPFMGIEPTGRRIELEGLNLQWIADDRVAHHWTSADFMGLVRRLKA